MQQYGTSYYLATLFFPRVLRNQIFELYKFVRIPDQVVDTTEISSQEAQLRLQELFEQWKSVYEHQDFQDNQFGAIAKIFVHKGIPFERSEAFFQAMLADTTKKTYETYEELQHYMYGSAEVVGLMMCKIIGISSPLAYDYARKLGEAMQLSNFLRDVKEDWLEYGRIYLPLEDLHRFGLTHRNIKDYAQSEQITPAFAACMQLLIARADSLYQEALQGIQYLDSKGQKPVTLALKLYQLILRKIQKHHYNVFAASMRTTKLEKI